MVNGFPASAASTARDPLAALRQAGLRQTQLPPEAVKAAARQVQWLSRVRRNQGSRQNVAL